MEASKPRVLIFGTGAVGIVYAYILTRGGADVTAVCRSNHAVAKESGFTIQSQVFGHVTVKPTIVRSVAEACRGDPAPSPFDFIVVCCKALSDPLNSPAVSIAPAVSPQTAIVLAQNGISLEEEYRTLFPNNTIISGTVVLPVTQERPGFVVMGPLESLEIGTYPAEAPQAAKQAAKRFAEMFAHAGATCRVYDDVQPRRWIKLAVNASWNPLCCLARCGISQLLASSPGAVDLIKGCMAEVATIARSLGYAFPEEELEARMQFAYSRMESGDAKEPSMVGDLRNGRRLEVEAIVGNTVRIARKQGVATPILDIVYTLIKALDESIARDQLKSSNTL